MAKNLIAGDQRIIVADTTLAKAQELAGELGSNAEAMPVADAIGKADVIILAIYFDAIKQLITTYGDALAEKIIVDPSNPIAPDGRAASIRRSLRSNPQGSSSPPCYRMVRNSSKRLVH